MCYAYMASCFSQVRARSRYFLIETEDSNAPGGHDGPVGPGGPDGPVGHHDGPGGRINRQSTGNNLNITSGEEIFPKYHSKIYLQIP